MAEKESDDYVANLLKQLQDLKQKRERALRKLKKIRSNTSKGSLPELDCSTSQTNAQTDNKERQVENGVLSLKSNASTLANPSSSLQSTSVSQRNDKTSTDAATRQVPCSSTNQSKNSISASTSYMNEALKETRSHKDSTCDDENQPSNLYFSRDKVSNKRPSTDRCFKEVADGESNKRSKMSDHKNTGFLENETVNDGNKQLSQVFRKIDDPPFERQREASGQTYIDIRVLACDGEICDSQKKIYSAFHGRQDSKCTNEANDTILSNDKVPTERRVLKTNVVMDDNRLLDNAIAKDDEFIAVGGLQDEKTANFCNVTLTPAIGQSFENVKSVENKRQPNLRDNKLETIGDKKALGDLIQNGTAIYKNDKPDNMQGKLNKLQLNSDDDKAALMCVSMDNEEDHASLDNDMTCFISSSLLNFDAEREDHNSSLFGVGIESDGKLVSIANKYNSVSKRDSYKNVNGDEVALFKIPKIPETSKIGMLLSENSGSLIESIDFVQGSCKINKCAPSTRLKEKCKTNISCANEKNDKNNIFLAADSQSVDEFIAINDEHKSKIIPESNTFTIPETNTIAIYCKTTTSPNSTTFIAETSEFDQDVAPQEVAETVDLQDCTVEEKNKEVPLGVNQDFSCDLKNPKLYTDTLIVPETEDLVSEELGNSTTLGENKERCEDMHFFSSQKRFNDLKSSEIEEEDYDWMTDLASESLCVQLGQETTTRPKQNSADLEITTDFQFSSGLGVQDCTKGFAQEPCGQPSVILIAPLKSKVSEAVENVKIEYFQCCRYMFAQHKNWIQVWRQESNDEWLNIFMHQVEKCFHLQEMCVTKSDQHMILIMLLKKQSDHCLQFLLFEREAPVPELIEHTHWLVNKDTHNGITPFVILCPLESLKFTSAQGTSNFYVHLHSFTFTDGCPALVTTVLGSTSEPLNSICGIEKLPNALMGIGHNKLYLWHILEMRLVTSITLTNNYLPIESCIWATLENGLVFFLTICEDEESLQVCQLLAANLATGFCQSTVTYHRKPNDAKEPLPNRFTKAAYREPCLVAYCAGRAHLWTIMDEHCFAALDCNNVTSVALDEDLQYVALGNSDGCVNCYKLTCD